MAKKSELEVLAKAVKDHTKKWATKYFTEKTKLSEKAVKLSKLCGELTHGKTDKATLAKIFSELSGEDIVLEAEEDVELRPIVALVLTKLNTTDAKHNYETEQVILSTGDGTAITAKGDVGGFIPKKRSIMRPATEAEIDAIPKAQFAKLLEEVNIIVAE